MVTQEVVTPESPSLSSDNSGRPSHQKHMNRHIVNGHLLIHTTEQNMCSDLLCVQLECCSSVVIIVPFGGNEHSALTRIYFNPYLRMHL
jgi:hypothetical protein